ncbi:Iron-uptake system permease protein FeuB [Paenibacillus solanacearum]|uniref:Iron-uptake system permease protein FeuB n=1 Tax=Paenibacillus solanacearum TaxID=2048548 RepID=A0A916K9M6_9BACL|nr:iron ABC transporter permease [Paenibacillus solanacearum]CAG7649445.1 Iron-uptake system permease protein FeuB [Paenibacillus solanacearum]
MTGQQHSVSTRHRLQSEKRRIRPSLLLCGLLLALIVGTAGAVVTGAASIRLSTVAEAFRSYDPEQVSHYTIMSVRLPRAIIAILAGASFAISGAIMQGMTRNPLASPGLMGVSAGSGFAIVLVFVVAPYLAYHQMIAVSMIGAACGTLLVYGVGVLGAASRSQQYRNVKLALAGSAVSALLGACAEGLQIYYGLAQTVMQWYTAGLSGVKWIDVRVMLPWTAAGGCAALAISRSLSALALGDEIASGLGQRVARTKWIGACAVFALTGSAVAIVGPISFIGLMVPHLVRFLIGVNYRWIIPCAGLMGGALLLFADTASRLVNMPRETPAGIITAVLGVPFFLYLARQDGRGGL